MKRYFFGGLFLLYTMAGLSQPTQAELDKMLKEAKELIKNIDPDTKKTLDSLGVKLPGVPEVPKIDDKKLAETYEDMTRVVPKRDATRIARVPVQVMPNTAIPAYITKTHLAVASFLPAQVRTESEQISQYVKTQNSSPEAIAVVASGLWISGNYKHALYLMGKATAVDPANADNLNNYAAFLTMTGAEQLALPILMNINKQFPKNSTILNNIGQAWFGLGELDKANKYLDSAILMFATHGQANFTKCLIVESKGDKTKAIEAMKKSIKDAYSKEKDNKLRNLGHEVNDKDLTWHIPVPADALGLERFFLPPYPMNTDQVHEYEPKWKAFKIECKEKRKIWDEKNKKLYPEQEKQALDEQKRLIAAVANKERVGSSVLIPFYHSKAVKKLKYLVEDKDGSFQYKQTKLIEEQRVADEQVVQLEKKMMDELNKVMDGVFVSTINGDGGVSEEQYCQTYNGVVNKYLPQANRILYEMRLKQLEFQRKYTNNQSYYNMFVMDPLTFEIFKNGAKAGWLNSLESSPVKLWKCTVIVPKKKAPEQTSSQLPDFDDLNCKYHSSLNIFGVLSIDNDCSRMTTKFDHGPLKLDIKENLNTGEVIRGTVEIHVKKGFEVGKGPVKAELEVSAGVQIEIEKSGISDVIVKAGAEVSAGTDVINSGPDGDKTKLPPGVKDKSVAIGGVEARYGWNSGGAVEGKGILKGISSK